MAEVVLKDGARLEHCRLQEESLQAFHIANTAVQLGRGSSYNSTAINLFGWEPATPVPHRHPSYESRKLTEPTKPALV